MRNAVYLKEFTKYTSLNIIAMLSVSLFIIADTYFIARAMGAYGLAALNFALPIFGFTTGSALMLGIGGGTIYNIRKSRNDHAGANRAFTRTILCMIGFIVFFVLCGLFFAEPITAAFGTDEAVFHMTRIYIQVILLFAPILLTNTVLMSFMRNDGAPKLAMIAMVSNSMGNIVLDYVFIIWLDMGMFGAALATGFSTMCGLAIFSTHFIRKRNGFTLVRCTVPLGAVREIFATGFPSLVAELSVGIVIMAFNVIMLRLAGNVGVAAYGVIANILTVVIAIYNGIALGTQPLISRYHGSGDGFLVKLMLRYALLLAAGISALVYLGVFFGANQITAFFNSEQNPLLQSLAVTGLRITFIGCVFAGFNMVMSIYFTSTENVRPAHVISLLRGFVLILPMVFFLSAVAGVTGAWLTTPLTELMAAGVSCGFYFLHRRKRRA